MTLQTKRRRRNEKGKNDRLITLNVSGRKFVTWERTLRKHPSTLLGSEKLLRYFDEKRKEYFLDRDPHMFRYILNFYRGGKLHSSSEDCFSAFKEELMFYGISPDNIEPCCWEDNTKITIRKPPKRVTTVSRGGSVREKIWLIMEAPDSSRLGELVQCLIGVSICLSILFTIIETIRYAPGRTLQESYPALFTAVDSTCIGVFTVEYLLRMYAAQNRLKLFLEKLSIIDLLTIIPFYVDIIINNLTTARALLGADNPLTLLRILRIVRMFKLSRHARHMRVVGRMLKRAFIDLGFLFFGFFLTNVLFSTVMFYLEYGQTRGKFTSIPDTMWYTVVTMMTIGYGDMVPVTVLGKILGSLCCLMGIMMLALPTTMMQKSVSDSKKVGIYSNLHKAVSNDL